MSSLDTTLYRPHRSFVGHPHRLIDYLASRADRRKPVYGHPVAAYEESFVPRLAARVHDLSAEHGWTLPAGPGDRGGDPNEPLTDEEATWIVRLAGHYLASPHVDDLYEIPGVSVERVGHRQSPGAARRELLLEIGQLPPRRWVLIDRFVQHLSQVTPLLYRPMRDHHNWRLRGHAPGLGLVEDGSFVAVEGSWAAHIVAGPLTLFGVVALGFDAAGRLRAFRLTSFGAALLTGEAPPRWAAEQENWVVVQPSFEVLMPATADGFVEEVLRRVARPQGGDVYRSFQIDREAVLDALESGHPPDRLVGDLAALSRAPLPQNVRFELDAWVRSYGTLRIGLGLVVELDDPGHLDELLHVPALAPHVHLLGERAALVRPEGLAPLVSWALERSLLPHLEGDLVRLSLDRATGDKAAVRRVRRRLAEHLEGLATPKKAAASCLALLSDLTGRRPRASSEE